MLSPLINHPSSIPHQPPSLTTTTSHSHAHVLTPHFWWCFASLILLLAKLRAELGISNFFWPRNANKSGCLRLNMYPEIQCHIFLFSEKQRQSKPSHHLGPPNSADLVSLPGVDHAPRTRLRHPSPYLPVIIFHQNFLHLPCPSFPGSTNFAVSDLGRIISGCAAFACLHCPSQLCSL